MHVVTNDGAVLEKVTEAEKQVLREISYRNYEERTRLINNPCVVRLDISAPPVARRADHRVPLLDPHFNGFDRDFEVKRAIRRPVRAGWRVAIVEEIDTLVIGEESVARVKAGCGRK